MRVFLAAAFTPPLAPVVRAARDALEPAVGKGWRFADPESVHVTLLFLGEIGEELVLPMTRAAAETVAGVPGARVATAGWGAFPDPARARVLWLGLSDPEGGLLRMAGALREAFAGFPVRLEERLFVPHATLARRGEGRGDAGLRALLARLPPPAPVPLRVEEVVFYKSVLGSRGAVHTVLARFPAGSAA